MFYPLSRETLLLHVPFAIFIGVAGHLLYFIHGEHHMQAPRIMWGHLFIFGSILCSEMAIKGSGQGIQDGLVAVGAYVIALFTSIIIYRKFFHRLRKFPGPSLAGVSKLWHMSKTLACKNHLLLNDLHKQYGDFVRTVMEGYEQRIQSHVRKLEQHIAVEAGNPIDVTEWIYFLAFDVMGDFAFAKSFNMLESKEWHYAVVLLRQALGLLGPFSSVPWLAQIAFGLPIIPVIRDWNQMLDWCAIQMAEQIQAVTTRATNISSHLINYSRKRNSILADAMWLKGDSVALIVAGSDTVASTLINLFYRMALHPDHAKIIQSEVATLNDVSDSEGLKELVHLDACINEVLRLHPSVPTGGYRETPPEGLEIGGTWIPGNVTIVAPRYTIGRLESLYEQPEDFIPERWYSKPEMIVDKKSFTPFSIGRYSCVGKKLALAEIRFTVALLLSKYDIAFAPHEDGVSVTRDMKDQFTSVPGKLDLVFTPRVEKA